MSKFSVVLVLILLSLPAAAQQGQKDFPVIVPSDWSILPSGKSNEWRAVSPRRDAWLSLYATPIHVLSLLIFVDGA
jgi:hypothetical protein